MKESNDVFICIKIENEVQINISIATIAPHPPLRLAWSLGLWSDTCDTNLESLLQTWVNFNTDMDK